MALFVFIVQYHIAQNTITQKDVVSRMNEKGSFSRKQFLTSSTMLFLSAIMGKFSNPVYAQGEPNDNAYGNVNTIAEKEWEEIPTDTILGAYLIDDTSSESFGGIIKDTNCTTTQYVPVFPGLKVILSGMKGHIWVGYNREFVPVAQIPSKDKTEQLEGRSVLTIPADVYYLRGSSRSTDARLQIWVSSFAVYTQKCGFYKPDLSSYTEISTLSVHQYARQQKNGDFNANNDTEPSLGDVFFTPIGTEIVMTFNNACIAPYMQAGDNFDTTERTNPFESHYGIGYSWHHCRTTKSCIWLGAQYAAANEGKKQLTADALTDAQPRLYIKFPSVVTGTKWASRARTENLDKHYQRHFTVVHVTDTHGDADSTHAAFAYADKIGAGFVALTGDYVPYFAYHGYDMLHTLIKNAATPTVYSLGNHDVSAAFLNKQRYSDKEIYDMNIAPIKDVLKAEDDHAYYYRDFQSEDGTVRAISLYPFYDKAERHDYGYYTEEQLRWLCEALASAPDGGHIFILRHFSHRRPIFINNQSMFYDYENSESGDNVLSRLNMRTDPVANIIDAYNLRKPFSAQYTGTLKDGEEAIHVKYDFSKRRNSEFVAYFTGHVHVDSVGYARHTQTRQAVICSLCTTGVNSFENNGAYTTVGSRRDYGTDSQIALNVCAFDFKRKLIHISRVGNGYSINHEKTFMSFPYAE